VSDPDLDRLRALYDRRPCLATHLECSATGEAVESSGLRNLSAAGKPLLVRYDLETAATQCTPGDLNERPSGLWRYRELLPVANGAGIVSLGEATTPLVALDRLAGEPGALSVKDESRLPTGSFKARGLALAVSMAAAQGATHLAMPTNGNAGAALAAYAARAGLAATVFCPADTPEINVREAAVCGATVHRVDGLIDDCGKLVAEHAATEDWFDVSTLKEPYRIEGKKTMGLELAEQLGWRMPDAIFYPTGGGTGLIGMWKAFQELATMGWIEGPLPRMIAVQAAGCAPIVQAFEAGHDHAERWDGAETVATGIRVPAAIGDFLILAAVRESGGFAIAVDDADILEARDTVARAEGMLLCPEGAATYAAYRAALRDGRIDPGDRAILFNCATGLKYPLPEGGRAWVD